MGKICINAEKSEGKAYVQQRRELLLKKPLHGAFRLVHSCGEHEKPELGTEKDMEEYMHDIRVGEKRRMEKLMKINK